MGRQHFVESYTTTGTIQKVEHPTEAMKECFNRQVGKRNLSEAIDLTGKPFNVWKFPISRINTYDKPNLNGRVYNRKLWTNVRDKQTDLWQRMQGLIDHPEDDETPSAGNGAIIWLDMDVPEDEDTVYGYGAFYGRAGDDFEDYIAKGGRLGFSSSGFGELMADSRTVDPDSFEIERLADIVINPSQGVFGAYEDPREQRNTYEANYAKDTEPEEVFESAKTKDANKLKEAAETGNEDSAILKFQQEKQMKVNAAEQNNTQAPETDQEAVVAPKMGKVEEKAWRNYVKSFVENASAIQNPAKRLEEMAEILSYFEEGYAPDLKEQVEAKMLEERANLEKLISEASAAETEFGMTISEMAEGTKKVIDEGVALKNDNETLQKVVEGLRAQNAELKAQNIRLGLKEKRATSKVEQVGVKENADIVALSAELKAMKEAQKVAARKATTVDHALQEAKKANSLLSKRLIAEKSTNEQLRATLAKGSTIAESTEKLLKENEDLKNELKATKLMLERSQKKYNNLYGSVMKERAAAGKAIREETRQIEEMLSEGKRKTQAIRDNVSFKENNGVDVEYFWQDVLSRYGEAALPFESQIRGAKTLNEATSNFYRHMKEMVAGINNFEEAREVGLNNSMIRSILQDAGYRG